MSTVPSGFAVDPSIIDTQRDESNYLTPSISKLLRQAEEVATELGYQWVTIKLLIAVLATNRPLTDEVPYMYRYMEQLLSSDSLSKFGGAVCGALDVVLRRQGEAVPVQGCSDSIADAICVAHKTRKDSQDMWTSIDHLVLALLASQEAEFLDPILEKLHTSRQNLINSIAARMEPKEDDSWSPLCDRLWGKRKTCHHLLSSKWSDNI